MKRILLNVFTALKGTHFYVLFVVTAAGVVPCGSPKKRPRTSSTVQFIFYFWSFEISRNILRNQKYHRFRFIYSKQFKLIEPHLDLYQSFYDFFAETYLKLQYESQFIQGH